MSHKKRHIWQETLPTISHYQGVYTVEHVRDFERETEHAAKQHFLTMDIAIDHITWCTLYQSLFEYKNLLAHYMIWFHIKNPDTNESQEIILSIEARRPEWDNYSLWKGIIPHMYDIIYIWGTKRDLVGLRTTIWKEPLSSHNMAASWKQAQQLFEYFAHRTNSLIHTPLSYHAIWYNCLTDLHAWLHTTLKKLSKYTVWTVLARWYLGYCQKKWVLISSQEAKNHN